MSPQNSLSLLFPQLVTSAVLVPLCWSASTWRGLISAGTQCFSSQVHLGVLTVCGLLGGALCPRPGLASLRLCRLCLPNQHVSAAQAPSQLMVTVLHDAHGEAFPPLYLPAQVSWLFWCDRQRILPDKPSQVSASWDQGLCEPVGGRLSSDRSLTASIATSLRLCTYWLTKHVKFHHNGRAHFCNTNLQ